MDKITVTSPLLPDLDEFQSMLKEIWGQQMGHQQWPVPQAAGTGAVRIPQSAVYQPIH